jgi:PEP-CTERM motif
MKNLLATLVLALATTVAFGGQAVVNGTVVADTGTEADPYELGSLVADSNTTMGVRLRGAYGTSFLEHATFTVEESVVLSGIANVITLTMFSANWIDIDNFQISLYDQAHGTGSIVMGQFSGDNVSFDLGPLAAGQYQLDFSGVISGTRGMGAYAVALHAAPIPEPSTYALLLAGLGVVAFVSRRRREMV